MNKINALVPIIVCASNEENKDAAIYEIFSGREGAPKVNGSYIINDVFIKSNNQPYLNPLSFNCKDVSRPSFPNISPFDEASDTIRHRVDVCLDSDTTVSGSIPPKTTLTFYFIPSELSKRWSDYCNDSEKYSERNIYDMKALLEFSDKIKNVTLY